MSSEHQSTTLQLSPPPLLLLIFLTCTHQDPLSCSSACLAVNDVCGVCNHILGKAEAKATEADRPAADEDDLPALVLEPPQLPA
eukprot:766497-Hanusia_phi.AAC.2